MQKSPVTGKSGAIRIQPLTLDQLRLAECHGKRDDEISKLRVVYDQKPIVHKGLNLMELYKRHTDGVFIPKAKTVVQHALFQFPTELVDGEDAEYMLRHSLAMAERIWGPDAVIAARVDRDEKSRHVVDVFICPKYLKQTKRESKVAVSMTKHMKELASGHGYEKLTTANIGRALQDFMYVYFRDVMKLEGVERGSAKSLGGSDWKSAEKLREQELDHLRALAKADCEASSKERAEAETRKLEQVQAQERAEADWAQKNAEIEEERLALTELTEQKRQTEIALRSALAATIAAREEAEAKGEKLSAERAEIARQKDENSKAMELHLRQIALLGRAMNDANGLELRVDQEGFAMNTSPMSAEEKDDFQSFWPPVMVKIGKALAQALQALRDAAADLLRQTREVEEERRKNAKLAADQRAYHEKALATLAEDREALNAKEAEIEEREAEAQAKLAEAIEREDATDKQLRDHASWVAAVEWFGARPLSARIGEKGSVETNVKLDSDIPPEIDACLEHMPPPWVSQQIARQHQLDCEIRKNRHSKRLFKELQAGKCVLKVEGDKILITRSGQTNSKRPRMEQIKIADLASWFIPLAQSHIDLLKNQKKAASLAEQLDKRLQDLSARFPERRPELDQERKAARSQIGDGLGVRFRGFDDRGM